MTKVIATFIITIILFTSCKGRKTNLEQLGNEKGIYFAVVIKNDKIILRQFYNGKTENDLFNVQSVTKSIMAILTGIAIDKGIIKSVDEPIINYFPELMSDKDTLKKAITIRHLLNQTSGIKDFEFPQLDKWVNDSNPTSLTLSQPLATKPGTAYQYNTAATHLLSAIISKSSKMETQKFADENLFKPLGITNYKWEKLKDGYDDGGGLSLWMKTDDLGKIGQLLLRGGEINNQKIISKQWINQLFEKENKLKAPWGLKNSLHGFCWYSSKYKNQIVNYAMGYGGQFIFIFPDLHAVVAINHNHDTAKGIEQSNIFFEKYLPLIFNKINE
jgi:CubicO group peptidase (beta-lactamase class C family)